MDLPHELLNCVRISFGQLEGGDQGGLLDIVVLINKRGLDLTVDCLEGSVVDNTGQDTKGVCFEVVDACVHVFLETLGYDEDITF